MLTQLMNKEICRILCGSNLYGTAIEGKSDKDFKGVVLPTWKEVALGKIPKNFNLSTGINGSKNTSEDIDTELFGIHEFVKLACEGQTISFDLLYAPVKMYQYDSNSIWKRLIANREKFHSKNIHAFIGYACGQASRYSLKGKRIDECETVIKFFNSLPLLSKLNENDLSQFPTGEFIKFIPANEIIAKHPSQPIIDFYEVCSKQFPVTSTVEYAKDIVQKYLDKYGVRAKLAAQEDFTDWKAYSHAFRVCYEAKELFTEGYITFPRPEANFLLQIKTGQLKMVNLSPMLDNLIVEVKELKENSFFPDSPDRKYWDNFLIEVVEEIYNGTILV